MASDNLERLSKSLQDPGVHIKMYVMDDNDAWVDFSSLEFGIHQDRLKSVSGIQHIMEQRVGSFSTAISTIELRNDDGFFNKPPDNIPLQTIFRAAAVFSSSSAYSRTVFFRRKVRLTAVRYVPTEVNAYEETILGTALWDRTTFSSENDSVTVRLKALSDRLRDIPADRITDGLDWYSAKPSWFLIQELAKLAYTDSNGDLPTEFNIQIPIQINSYDGSLTLSAFGPCGDYAKADGESEWTWKYPTQVARAAVYGTVSTTAGLWVGLDNSVWHFDPDTEQWTEHVLSTDLGSGYNVVFLHIQGTTLWGVAAQDEATYEGASRWANLGSAAKVFSYDGTTYTTRQSETNMWTGLSLYKRMRIMTANTPVIAGPGDTATPRDNGAVVVVPFDQRAFFKINDSGEFSAFRRKGMGTRYTSEPTTEGTADVTNLRASGVLKAAGVLDVEIVASGYPNGATSRAGWYYIKGPNQNLTFPAAYIVFSQNTQGAFIVKYDGTNTFLYYFVPGSTEGRWDFKATQIDATFTTSTKVTNANLNDDLNVTGTYWRDGVPCCAGGSGTDGLLYIGTYCEGNYNAANDNSNATNLWSYTESTTTFAEIPIVNGRGEQQWTNDSTAYNLWKLVELIWFNSTLVGVVYSEAFGTWGIAKDLQSGAALVDTIHSSLYQIKGLVEDTTNSKLYGYEVGTGRMVEIDTSWNVTVISNADSAVPDDPNLSAGLAIKQGTTPVIYGVSAPYYRPETQFEKPVGKYHLFKLDTKITDRIPLADFSSLTGWEAMSRIAEAIGAIVGFDANGNLFYRERSAITGTPDITLIHGSQIEAENAHPIQSMKINSGEADVYNFVELVPYDSVVLDPSYELKLRNRTQNETGLTADNQKSFMDFHVDLRSQLRRTIKMICTAGGNLDDADGKHFIRFKFLVVDRTVEARLVQNYTDPATTMSLSSVFGGDAVETGIHTGDFIIAVDPEDESTEVVKEITVVAVSTNIITIDSALGFDMLLDDTIQVVKRNALASNVPADWSDDGVTYLDTNASGTDNIADVNSVENLSTDMVVQIGQDMRRITTLDNSVSPPQITVLALDETTTQQNFSISWAADTLVRAWVAPNALDEFFELGGSGVFMKFVKPATGEVETEFRLGDVITIIVPGQKLEPLDHSKQTSVNLESVRNFGRKDYPARNNRFLSKILARNSANTLVGLFKDPTYDIDITLKLGLDIDLATLSGLTLVEVVSPTLLPHSAYKVGSVVHPYAVQCTVRSISHDIKRGVTKLRLKAIQAY